ncbi:MAG: Eco57I restriction-modification methylase domain-containing protein, partial [Planctomycetaceae bacterium]|nr:Eco57I restriction-modification methylase domain-containing protein [Planctomycetaceae bacterium]
QEWREGEKVGKVIILRDINTDNPHTGHLRILQDLANHNARNFNELHKKWLEVLDVNILNKGFYKRLVEWYTKCFNDIKINLTAASKILEKDIENELKPQAVIRVIVRMMFIWFMKEKGLIKDLFFKKDFAKRYLKSQDVYYNAVLQNLFFAVLNKKIDERRFRKNNPKNKYDVQSNDYGLFDVFRYKEFFKDENIANEFVKLTKTVPFVNGGLFQCHDYKFSGIDETANEQNTNKNYIIDGFSDNPKERAKISDEIIFELLDLFNSYVWTIEESTPSEQDIALDPELLGTVFENLIGFYNPETKENARKQTGSFYTPREIVDYMCRESLKETLKTKFPDLHSQIDDLIDNNEDQLNFPNKNKMLAAITNLKILDPACGSGAFPMGMFLLTVRTIEKLQERKTTYKNKLDIITNCIYGVDIQNIAIEISKLRFFISLLVDYKTPERIENFEMLPNLETKFVAANTLIGIEKNASNDLFGVNQAFEELTKIFLPFTTAKTPKEKEQIKNNFNNKKKEIVDNDHFEFGKDVKEKILKWDPFNVCYTSPFFDSVIMFGIKDGFDIVIGNPPYIDSETMTKIGLEWEREYIVKLFKYISGNWDIYMAFFEKGLNVTKNVLCYITPDKWLSKSFGLKFREQCMIPKMNKIIHAGSDVFENVRVDGIISLFVEKSEKLTTLKFNNKKQINEINNVDKQTIKSPYLIDYLFSKDFSLINKIERYGVKKISDFAQCESACAASDAYKLVPLIENNKNFEKEKYFILVNTGTLEKYNHKWGRKEITYLGKNLLYPIINKTNFSTNFGKSYVKKSTSPKIIFKGLNLLDACIDFEGNILPGKSTLVICNSDFDLLKILCALINSRLIFFYIKTKYSSSSYCGGITFTKDMINNLHISVIPPAQRQPIINLVDQILSAKQKNPFADTLSLEAELNAIVFHLYGLTESEMISVLLSLPTVNETERRRIQMFYKDHEKDYKNDTTFTKVEKQKKGVKQC